MKRTESKIVVAVVGEHAFKPELLNAELRMSVKTTYPARQANSGGLYDEEEYNLEGEDFTSERVCWIDVPKLTGDKPTTIEDVQKKLDTAPNARIMRTLSMKPILSPEQEAAIVKGLTDLETIANGQRVKNDKGEDVLHNGKVFYSKKQLSINGNADIDLRPAKIETPVVATAKVEENVESVVK